ncbi:MAG TPA: chorismate synthase [Fibrobacteraceae bacterium]|nr:chorismate synthase [Fibrobacteraceae bacterium]
MGNVFGTLFSVSTWGESHGLTIGAIVDGCPAGVPLDVADIQPDLDRRRPGQNALTTARNEADRVAIQSGIFEGKTTGTPIALIIPNEDQRSHDYSDMALWYRPSHADVTYDLKYGFRDYRGGGRSSVRESAARVAAGAIARKLLKETCGTEILACVSSVYDVDASIDLASLSREGIEASPVRCPNLEASSRMEAAIREAKQQQDSVGGVVTLLVRKPPVGIGEPVFDRVNSLLAHAMLSIPACKGFEIGSGFAGSRMRGSQHNDTLYCENGEYHTRTNRAGGTLGGISLGEDIVCRIAFKPTATISQPQQTASRAGENGTLAAKGRHDPCVVPRATAIVEAMAALTLVDLLLAQRARKGLF